MEELGKGAFGAVQKAYDKLECQFKAIKRFPKITESSEETRQGIMVEDDMLQAVEKIRASNTNNEQFFLKYDGVFRDAEDHNSLILQMESGHVSLQDIVKAGKTYQLAELIYVHRKLTEGFALLQEKGIANRDVKPGNVILVENPKVEGSFYPKISDFGISCKLEKGISTVPSTGITGLTQNTQPQKYSS